MIATLLHAVSLHRKLAKVGGCPVSGSASDHTAGELEDGGAPPCTGVTVNCVEL